jgi:hypothetical protein
VKSIKAFILFQILFFGYNSLSAQKVPTRFSFLDRGAYFDPIILDPTECQTTAGIMKIWYSGKNEDGVYIPVNIGLQQSISRFKFKDTSGLEIMIGAAAFTQFTIKKVEGNTFLGEMENADYKVAFLLNYKFSDLSLRLRFFHTSSHLSDDYILRNNITDPNPGTLNYEQLDLTGSYQIKSTRLYGGLGMVITPNAVRERFSAQAGVYYRRCKNHGSFIRFIFGSDLKIMQQNNYRPNFRSGAGIEIGKEHNINAAFMLEYYNGHLPYSVMEYKIVNWIGINFILVPERI